MVKALVNRQSGKFEQPKTVCLRCEASAAAWSSKLRLAHSYAPFQQQLE